MVTKTLSEGLSEYESWKENIHSLIEDIQNWLEEKNLFNEDSWSTIARCLDKIESDHITIAFVGEFSRGKTELINALFFAETGRRLLPSDAGRTTMCPTEITHDSERDEAYIRLLPIETRLDSKTLSEYRHEPDSWTEIMLDTSDTQSLEESFKELANTHHVKTEEAEKYGLLNELLTNPDGHHPKYIDIPKWRHAIISYPNKLLKQGLTIIDTPGLNAIGSEPELTLNMLPSAQSTIFVLGADTGVSQSDLTIWQKHLNGHIKSKRGRLTVVLNKIDTLWDDLRSDEEIDDTIKSQILSTARTLGIPLKKIFPVSAQKGLIGRVRKDDALYQRSGIIDFEDHLNHEVSQSKQMIIRQDISDELEQMLLHARQILQQRLKQDEEQLEELANIHQQSDSAIGNLLEKTQLEQEQYRQNTQSLLEYEEKLDNKSKELLLTINLDGFNQVIQQAGDEIEKSWTSKGISKAVELLVSTLKSRMEDVQKQIDDNSQIIRGIYRHFEQNHGIGVIQPKVYSLVQVADMHDNILSEAEAFAKGYRITFVGQSRIVKSFLNSLAFKAREMLENIEKDMQHWLSSSLQPLAFQIEDHKEILNRQIHDLKMANHSREKLDEKLAVMASGIESHNHDIQSVSHLIDRINRAVYDHALH